LTPTSTVPGPLSMSGPGDTHESDDTLLRITRVTDVQTTAGRGVRLSTAVGPRPGPCSGPASGLIAQQKQRRSMIKFSDPERIRVSACPANSIM
jgi:hypothetical protein